MAAYAAVASLMTTIDYIQNHPIHSFSLDKKQIQPLHYILSFLLDFIESYNCRRGSKEDADLERRIACAAHAAEDVIESHVVDRIRAGETSSSSLLDLEAVIKDVNSVGETVMAFQGTEEFRDVQQLSFPALSTSFKPLITAKNVMVGFDDELIQIMDRLTGQQSNLQIVPIVRMGGIGKTTLANNVFENLVIVERFDIRAWATISQEYSVKNILSEINKSLGGFDCETVDQLGLKIYQSLWGRRYLIVLDDMWSIEVWDRMKFFFPDNDCGSRVVVTTRISNVATHLSSLSFEMNFLDEDKSWKLFCEKTFLEEGCPPELEGIGKKIARNCKGLPLSISVIGGLLRNSRRREYWKSVARDTNSTLMMEKHEHCLNILSLSYNHLPAHLKPCFLYMIVSPKYNELVYVTQLIKIFVAEGFLKPNKTQRLEEIAYDYLNDLVDRNLVTVTVKGRKWNGTIKYLRMHDLVREVCLRIAEKEKFFYRIWVNEKQPYIDFSREHRIHLKKDWSQDFAALPTESLASTFSSHESELPSHCRLLRVLSYVSYGFMEDIIQLVNLRYVAYIPYRTLSYGFRFRFRLFELPSSISLLWNLQMLVMPVRLNAPVEIWNLRQLRHLQFTEVFLPDPPSDKVDQQGAILLPNLQTLETVMNFSFTEEVCKRIPNIMKLGIRYNDFSGKCRQKSYYYLNNLANLLKLESLNCSFHLPPERDDLLKGLMFPRSLKELTLRSCQLHWEDLETYGFSMPNLEVLKLDTGSVVGPKWDCVEGAYPSLRFLKIYDADVIEWTAQDSDFPKLEKLHLHNMNKLENIPSGVGDIHTLQYLHLYRCSESASISATEILEEQRSLENYYLQVKVVPEVRRKYPDQEQKFFSWKNIFSKLNFICMCKGLKKYTTS